MIFSGSEANSQSELGELSWKDKPTPENYTNAFQYLSLLTSLQEANDIVERLIDSKNTLYRSVEDIIRAAGLNPPRNEYHYIMPHDLISPSKKSLSPILLVQAKDHSKVHIVDGYDTLMDLYSAQKGHRVACILTAWESE